MNNTQNKRSFYLMIVLLLTILCLLLTGCGSKDNSQTAKLPELVDNDPNGANDRVNDEQPEDVVSVRRWVRMYSLIAGSLLS